MILLTFHSCAKEAKMPKKVPEKNQTITASSFHSVWNEIAKDPLKALPQNKISYSKLSAGQRDIISEDAKRTLQNRADILPYFEKLAHPNGICLRGTWRITQKNPYGGYFKKGSQALIIARASSAMSKTKQGETKAFGLAGKLFPTQSPKEVLKTSTANFFLIDDLGGTDARYFTEVALTNEPSVSTTGEVFKNLLYAVKVASTFSKADTHSGIRQLYEIAYLGERSTSKIITPKWMKIQAREIQKEHAKDFRSELFISVGQKLVFDIWVSSKETEGKKVWQPIGEIIFNTSMVSKSCDHQLHFHHPLFREDIIYE